MRALASTVVLAFALCGCFFSSEGDGDGERSVALSATSLAGSYRLIDYLLEYQDGRRFDTSSLKIGGILDIDADSSIIQQVQVNGTPSVTAGKILKVWATDVGNTRGRFEQSLQGSGSNQVSAFSFRGDTLELILDYVPKEAGKVGFHQVQEFLRISTP